MFLELLSLFLYRRHIWAQGTIDIIYVYDSYKNGLNYLKLNYHDCYVA